MLLEKQIERQDWTLGKLNTLIRRSTL
jgi:hypothetical protein